MSRCATGLATSTQASPRPKPSLPTCICRAGLTRHESQLAAAARAAWIQLHAVTAVRARSYLTASAGVPQGVVGFV
eukprot:118255-Pyramimonas_sp.AAC.1